MNKTKRAGVNNKISRTKDDFGCVRGLAARW